MTRAEYAQFRKGRGPTGVTAVVFIHPKYALIHPKYALTHTKYGSPARIIAIAQRLLCTITRTLPPTLFAMLGANLWNVNLLADSGSAAEAAASDLPSWLLDLGPLGLSAIIGGVVVAAVNHFLTRRRERGAWLRQLQVEASEKFRAKAASPNNHVAGGPVDKAIQTPHFEGLDTAIEGIQPLIQALVDEFQEMTLIAEQRTLLLAAKVMHILPKLAWQAAILRGTNCEASRKQRDTALTAMVALNLDMSAVMRADIGLGDIRPLQPPEPNRWRRTGNRLRAWRTPCHADHFIGVALHHGPGFTQGLRAEMRLQDFAVAGVLRRVERGRQHRHWAAGGLKRQLRREEFRVAQCCQHVLAPGQVISAVHKHDWPGVPQRLPSDTSISGHR